MRFGCLNPLVAVCIFAVASGHARAQPLFSSTVSIDCTVLNADVVVVGRVTDVNNVDPINVQPAYTATIAVEETLKGEHHRRVPIRFTNPNSLLMKAKDSPRQLFLVTAQGDPLMESQTIDLSDEELEVLTADFELLRKPENVIRRIKEVIRHMPGVKRIETFDLAVPRESVVGTKWEQYYMTGGYLRLQVPVDERLEKRAREYFTSKHCSQRQEGAQALRYFKSDENIARVKSLLDDAGWAYLYRAEENRGIEVRIYGVREKAYETLDFWGVEAEKPLVRDEVRR